MALGAYAGEQSRGNLLNALAHPNVVNPAAAILQGTQAANAVWSNREAQAQNAWGLALQAATDPDTGVVDYRHAAALASQDPHAAMGMMKNLATSSAIQGQQLEQAGQHFGLVASQAPTLMRDPSDANVNSIVQNFKDAGYPDSMTANLQQRLLAMSPQQRQTFAYQQAVGSLNSLDRLNRFTGTQQTYMLPQGPVTATTAAPEAGGNVNVTGFTPSGLGPADLNKTVDLPDMNRMLPNGQPNPDYLRTKSYRYGDWLTQFGGQLQPGAKGGVSGTTPPAPSPAAGNQDLGTGRYSNVPPALRNAPPPAGDGGGGQQPASTTPSPSPAPAAPAAGPPSVTTGPSPSEAELAKGAGGQFKAETDADVGAQSQIATLDNLRTDLAQFTPGPGISLQKHLGQIVSSWAPGTAKAMGITDPTAATENFDKAINQILQQQGAGSDARLAVNIAATPSSSMTPQGIDLILRQLQGNADYLRARASLANQYPSKSDYSGFQDAIKNLDPRVFQYDRMDPEQKHTWYMALSGPQKRTFQKAYGFAERPDLPWAGNRNLIPSGGSQANAAGG